LKLDLRDLSLLLLGVLIGWATLALQEILGDILWLLRMERRARRRWKQKEKHVREADEDGYRSAGL